MRIVSPELQFRNDLTLRPFGLAPFGRYNTSAVISLRGLVSEQGDQMRFGGGEQRTVGQAESPRKRENRE